MSVAEDEIRRLLQLNQEAVILPTGVSDEDANILDLLPAGDNVELEMENRDTVSVRQNEEPAEQDSVQSGKREKMVVCPKCCSIVSNYAGVCPRCKAILSSNRTTNLNTANSQKASSASWLDEYKKNTLKADSGTSKYHSLQETEMSGDWRREELRRSDLRKDEAKIEKVYTSPTSNFYYDYDETDCGPDSLSDSYWDYHGCD